MKLFPPSSIATPITFPRALIIALPLAPVPFPPKKSTLGGPHLRTFVLQSGALGNAGIPSAISSIPSAILVRRLNPKPSIKESKLSSSDSETPFFEENTVGGEQLTLSQSRTFVRIFANLIAFENVALGSAIPPP